jgi:GDP-mannose transporter
MADDKKRDDFAIDMGERNTNNFQRPISPLRHNSAPSVAVVNNPIFPVLSYCASSILMTVTNKFVLSGLGFNLNFFLLCVQVRMNQGTLEVVSAD